MVRRIRRQALSDQRPTGTVLPNKTKTLRNDGLQPSRDGLQPSVEMASNLIVNNEYLNMFRMGHLLPSAWAVDVC